MALGRSSDEGIEEFWRETEEQIGEAVAAYGLARYISGGEAQGPLWGLVYVTATRVFFRHFAQGSWFSSILGSGDSASLGGSRKEKSAKERNFTLEWRLARFHGVEQPRATGNRLRRLFFGGRTVPITLVPISEGGIGGVPVILEVEHNREAVIAALERAFAG